MNKPETLQLSANATVWYAIESLLRTGIQQENAFGGERDFAKRNLELLTQAITAAEEGDGTAQLF
jgi:hypothetical protein